MGMELLFMKMEQVCWRKERVITWTNPYFWKGNIFRRMGK